MEWLSGRTRKPYRLLSESEWEYATRAGTQSRYHWGDSIGRTRANCSTCVSRPYYDEMWKILADYGQTAPVGFFAANDFGLHDMHGNVKEWVEDCWHDDYSSAPSDGSAWTSDGNCKYRVLRGGSWNYGPSWIRSANRDGAGTGYRNNYIGFRVARDACPLVTAQIPAVVTMVKSASYFRRRGDR